MAVDLSAWESRQPISGRADSFQLDDVLGVEEEHGFNLNTDKYNWEEHRDHFILKDAEGEVDFGEGKKNIYALTGNQKS